MPRKARFTLENATYHILSRGNNKQRVFLDSDDYKKFMDLLIFYKKKYDLRIYHYVLMTNHYHLILQVKDGPTLASAMKGLNLAYATYYRRKYGGVGYLWQGRFKSFVIQDGKYILECGRYIELNPVRARIVEKAEDYPWTSASVYVKSKSSSLIDVNPEYFGMSEDEQSRCRIYNEYLSYGIKERRKLERYFKASAYGSNEFIEIMKSTKGLKLVWSHKGRPKKVRACGFEPQNEK